MSFDADTLGLNKAIHEADLLLATVPGGVPVPTGEKVFMGVDYASEPDRTAKVLILDEPDGPRPVYVISRMPEPRRSMPFVMSLMSFLNFTMPPGLPMSRPVGSRGPDSRKRSWKQRGKFRPGR